MTAQLQRSRRTREIAQIHTLAKQLRMDEPTRRARMERVGGARSAADLTDKGRRDVIQDLRRELGGGGRRKERPKHQRLVVGIWLEAYDKGVVTDKRDRAIDAFVERQTGVAKLEWLTAAKATSVIEALKDMIRRGRRNA
jgi:phage gp16-like protein